MDDEPIRQQLEAGEHLLWSGRPRQGIRATCEEQAGGLIGCITAFVFWLLVVAIGTWVNLRDVEGQVNFGALSVGLSFLMIGWAMIAFALGFNVVDRAHKFYGLTGQRIIQITGVLCSSIRSYPLQQLQRIDVQARGDGSGTITFADVSYTRWGNPVVPTFEKIDNVQSVYDLIQMAKDQAHERGPDR